MTGKSYILPWLLLAAAQARSDTINRKDHVSINGTIQSMSNNVLILEEQTSSGLNILRVPVTDVESIEFNSHTRNPPPTAPVGLGGPVSPASTAVQPVPSGVLVLRNNGGRQTCKLLSIDANQVHCNPDVGPSPYNRSRVLRIVLGAQ